MDNRKILFIEDDDAHAKLMKIAFSKNCTGCEIVHVKDGKEALAWLEDVKSKDLKDLPRLILLDLNIPIINGVEVLKIIKNDDILKILSVVILTTSNSNTDIKNCYQENANSYLVKPIIYNDYAALMEKIQEYWIHGNMPASADYI